jgi:hypothetical protein
MVKTLKFGSNDDVSVEHTVELTDALMSDLDFDKIDNVLHTRNVPIAVGKVWEQNSQGWFRPYGNVLKSKFVHLPYTYGTSKQDIANRVRQIFIDWGYHTVVNTMTGNVFIGKDPADWGQ